ncbi:MAG: fibronectin type III domain-containing protein [bacterium]|nr:fibronectin type III domain-containing protein [bacterium]
MRVPLDMLAMGSVSIEVAHSPNDLGELVSGIGGRRGGAQVGEEAGTRPRSARARILVALLTLGASLAIPGLAQASVPFPEVPNDGWDVLGDVFAVKAVGNTVWVGGDFSHARAPGSGTTVARTNLAAFDMTTGDVLPFVADTNNTVRAIESDGSTVWFGGNFSSVGGQSRSGIAAVDAVTGAVRPGFDVSNNGAVYGLGLGNGRLYVGGYFTVIEGVSQGRVASLDPTSGIPNPLFQANANESARDVVVSATGRLFVGGGFTDIGGASERYLAELDPETGAATGPGFEFVDAPILDVDVTPDGSMVFAAVAGFQNRSQAWNTFDGTRRWFHRAMGDTQAVAYYDGNLFFGFHEGFENDLSVRLLAVDVLTGELTDFRPAVNSFFGIWAIDANSVGLAGGGEFTNVSGIGTRGIAVFPGDGSAADTSPPAAPSGLANPDPSGERVELEWTVPFDDRGVSYYRVFRDGALVGETLDPFFVDPNVAGGTEYSYQVQAMDLAGNVSPLSAPFDIKTWTNLVTAGDSWRHSDAPRTSQSWLAAGFDDGSWGVGNAELGFGDGGEVTVLDPGSMTYYFRKEVVVPENEGAIDAHMSFVRDDGAVIYVNGQEVGRSNMPAGTITSSTQALGTAAGADETRWFDMAIDPDLFQPGVNVVAVEVHQRSLGSSDVSFDLQLDVSLDALFVDTESPTKPQSLVAKPKRATRVRVVWDGATDNVAVAGYRVFRDGEEIGFTADLYYVDNGLWPLTDYRYKVRAVDAAGNSSQRSRIGTATTLADEDAPSRPKNVSLSATTDSITVDWDPATDNVEVSHYLVKSSGEVLTSTLDTSFVYEDLDPDTLYHIVVKAIDVFGNHGKKKHLWITTPPVSNTYQPIVDGDLWKYLDDGSEPTTSWRHSFFNDQQWGEGTGEFGYGDGDETTVVDGGPTNDRHITAYFRNEFEIVNAAAVTGLELRLIRDDGAVVYLNGVEVYRDNMPTGTIDADTLAVSGISGNDEDDWIVVMLGTNALVTGTNALAIEVHQVHRTSSDLSFNAELTVNPAL